jgi:hypothetical protein
VAAEFEHFVSAAPEAAPARIDHERRTAQRRCSRGTRA